MKKSEIGEFIEAMKKVGDLWTEEQVELVYGNVEKDEAILDRQAGLGRVSGMMWNIING